jgi:hypothetical protein
MIFRYGTTQQEKDKKKYDIVRHEARHALTRHDMIQHKFKTLL